MSPNAMAQKKRARRGTQLLYDPSDRLDDDVHPEGSGYHVVATLEASNSLQASFDTGWTEGTKVFSGMYAKTNLRWEDKTRQRVQALVREDSAKLYTQHSLSSITMEAKTDRTMLVTLVSIVENGSSRSPPFNVFNLSTVTLQIGVIQPDDQALPTEALLLTKAVTVKGSAEDENGPCHKRPKSDTKAGGNVSFEHLVCSRFQQQSYESNQVPSKRNGYVKPAPISIWTITGPLKPVDTPGEVRFQARSSTNQNEGALAPGQLPQSAAEQRASTGYQYWRGEQNDGASCFGLPQSAYTPSQSAYAAPEATLYPDPLDVESHHSNPPGGFAQLDCAQGHLYPLSEEFNMMTSNSSYGVVPSVEQPTTFAYDLPQASLRQAGHDTTGQLAGGLGKAVDLPSTFAQQSLSSFANAPNLYPSSPASTSGTKGSFSPSFQQANLRCQTSLPQGTAPQSMWQGTRRMETLRRRQQQHQVDGWGVEDRRRTGGYGGSTPKAWGGSGYGDSESAGYRQ